jgi:hypothetical protein
MSLKIGSKTMPLVFEFDNLIDAQTFVFAVKQRYGRDGTALADERSRVRAEHYPSMTEAKIAKVPATPITPSAYIERPDFDDEDEIIELVREFNGRFIGT